MSKLIFFHDFLLLVCYFVLFFIVSLMGSMFVFSGVYLKNLGNSLLEIFWTVVPALVLLVLVEPSLVLLYYSESFSFLDSQMVKVTGHQWFWSYESDLLKGSLYLESTYDSYMSGLETGDFRNLEVDLPVVVLPDNPVTFFVSSSDVIHSFAIPSLGMKADAFPGRLKVSLSSKIPVGCYWGQCSEICGANHAFMPIGLESIFVDNFDSLLDESFMKTFNKIE